MTKDLGRFAYSLCLALWVGGISMFTFVVTPLIFGSFRRDEASHIVDTLFGVYFYYVLTLSLAATILFLVFRGGCRGAAYRMSLAMLAVAVVINLYTAFGLYPEIREVKRGVTSFETEPPDSPARKEFGRLHAISAVLNLLVLSDGAVLLYLNSKDYK